MAAVNKRQPPPGYPTGGNAKVEAPKVDNNTKAQQTDGEEQDETDRGISARFITGRPKPRSYERYPGHGIVPFDDYDPAPPRYKPAPGYDHPPHGYGGHGQQPYGGHPSHGQQPYGGHPSHGQQPYVEFVVSDDEDNEDDYENEYSHQPNPYHKKPQQYYRRETYVVDEPPPPPPPRRRPSYPPESNYYVRDEYARYN